MKHTHLSSCPSQYPQLEVGQRAREPSAAQISSPKPYAEGSSHLSQRTHSVF